MLQLFLALIEEETEKERFERLYYRYQDLMYCIAVEILRDAHLAEDAVQEAFFRVARNFRKVGKVESVQTRNFLALITRNVSLSMAEDEKKQPGAANLSPEQQASAEERGLLYKTVPDAAFDVVSTAELKEVILSLPQRYRSVLYLAGVYEYSQAEIASLLNLPVETVKKRMQRGRLMLRQALKENEDEDYRKKKDGRGKEVV